MSRPTPIPPWSGSRGRPSVSAVIPCFNAAAYIADTIDSVLRQSATVDEIIVVDDESTDGSGEIAAARSDRVRVIRQSNRGECGARNTGTLAAEGDVIAFLDADDLWHPRKIERQLQYLAAHPDVGAVTTGITTFRIDPAEELERAINKDSDLQSLTPLRLLTVPWISQSAIAIRREVARAALYPEGITDSGDMIQTVMMRQITRFGGVEEKLAHYRRHPAQTTGSGVHYARSLAYRIEWARRNYEVIGGRTPDDALRLFARAEFERVMQLYWNRELERFRRMRDELVKQWPIAEPPPDDLTRYVPPRLLARVVDMLDARTGNLRARIGRRPATQPAV